MDRRELLFGASVAAAFSIGPSRSFAEQSLLDLMEVPFSKRGAITNGLLATAAKINTRKPVMSLTFDDGPHPFLTPMLLDLLKLRQVRATFYVIGRDAAHSPDILRRMIDEGHEIGNHSWSHPVLSKWSHSGILKEIDRTNDAVFAATGIVPRTFRPPYGAFEPHQRYALVRDRHMPTILWSVDPEDWRRPGSKFITDFVLKRARPGAIVLTHDIHRATIRSWVGTLDGLILL